MDILIVGAGPTGLTTAVELSRLGIIPTVIDKRTEPSGLSRAVGITPSSLKLLAPSGVTEKLLAATPPLTGICGYFNDQQLLHLDFSEHLNEFDQYEFQTPLHCLPQDKTEAILAQQFAEAGGSVQFGNEFIDLEQHENHVTVKTTAEQRNYTYVVAADGIGSKVRQAVNIEYTGIDLPEPWSIADLDVTNWPHPLEFCAFLTSGESVCVAAPIGENRVRLVSNTASALDTLPVPIEVLRTRRASTFTVSVRQAVSFTKHRVFLAGDAAHCHSPVGGRGMNLGIADAAQLATCIANNTVNDYHTLRYSQATDTMAMTERGRRLLTSSSSLSRVIKPSALKLLNASTFLKRRMIQSVLDE